VNSISFHPQHGTFATAGADGTFTFWDKDSKSRLNSFKQSKYRNGDPAPISAGCFNNDGSIYAYAVSYDWSKGHAAYDPASMPNQIFLHSSVDEAKPKNK